MPDKVDFKRTLDHYRAKAGEFRLVEVPATRYLMVDGQGDPNTAPEYEQALQALYPVAYKLKFASERELGRDYVVPPLEGLWWADDMAAFTTRRNKDEWRWTMMLMVPDWLGQEMVEAAVAAAGAKDPADASRRRAPGGPHGGPLRADAAPGLVRRRGSGPRAHAPWVHPAERPAPDRQAPRDLLQRPAQGGAGEAEDHTAAAGGAYQRVMPAMPPNSSFSLSSAAPSANSNMVPLLCTRSVSTVISRT